MSRYNVGDVILTDWRLKRKLGEGSFGKVFEAEREDFGRVYKAAVKIVTIPQSDSEIKSAQAEGMDRRSISAYFKNFAEQLVDEFDLMSRLKGTSNIVSYEDHRVVPHSDGIGWDVFIRMELLTPLIDHVTTHPITRQDVIRLGIDLCKALELCQMHNIIHRDIKPENIFVSDNGDFKLGDFGIARTIEKTASGMSKKGTYTYMAPEVYKEEAYGSSADLYSLGIVLYWLLNESRAPFLPPRPADIKPDDREAALRRRIQGEPIPAPKNADGPLAAIVLRACAYDPRARYSNPTEMRRALEALCAPQGPPLSYVAQKETPSRTGPTEYTPTPKRGNEAVPPVIPQGGRAVPQREEETVFLDREEGTVLLAGGDPAARPGRSAPQTPAGAGRAVSQEEDPAFERPRKKRSIVLPLAVAAAAVLATAVVILLGVFHGTGKPSASQTSRKPITQAPQPEQAAATASEAGDYLCRLGIVDEAWLEQSAAAIDRGSWAKLVYRIATGSNDAEVWIGSAPGIGDISGHWAESYISYVVLYGYDCDDGTGSYNPDNDESMAEACKSMLVLLGYNAEERGYQNDPQWASNIMSDAESNGLLAGVDTTAGPLAPIDRRNAAQLIYNALRAEPDGGE